jgi:hypothetical protein
MGWGLPKTVNRSLQNRVRVRLLEEEDCVPGVRHVPRDEEAQLLIPEIQDFVVTETTDRPVGMNRTSP